uniref:Uncharacterized protein n=1 Tax=Arundo donax TaxID=35708 RepID=A0A0A8Y105_ARUDO
MVEINKSIMATKGGILSWQLTRLIAYCCALIAYCCARY